MKKLNKRGWMVKAWKPFSQFIRKSKADWRGYVSCVTCGATHMWNSGDIHAGHWIHDKLEFDERNIHPQCKNCNFKYNKNTNTAYGVYMARTYGAEEMENIRKAAFNKEDPSYRGNDYSIPELIAIHDDYKRRLEQLSSTG